MFRRPVLRPSAARLSAILPLTAAVAPLAAYAQSAGGALEADEIIVISNPFERPAQTTIQGVTILDREALARRLENSIGETLRREPGVTSTFFGQGASRPVIRGLGGDRISVLDAGIGTIDASVTSVDHFVTVDPATAQRVEIIRGPQTLLYGSSAAGGVVNVFNGRIPSVRPDGGVDGTLRVGGSTVDNGVETAGSFDVELGEFGGAAVVFHGDGFYRDAEDYDIPGFAESARLRAIEEAAAGPDDDDDEEEAFGTLENSFYETVGGSAGLSFIFDNGFFGVSATAIDTTYGLPGGHEHEEEDGDEEEEEEGGAFIDLEQRKIDFSGEIDADLLIWRKAKLRVGYADYEHAEFEGPGEIGSVFTNEGWEGRLELLTKPRGLFGGELNVSNGFQFRISDFSALGEEAFVPPVDSTQYGNFVVAELSVGKWLYELGGRYERTNREVVETGVERDFDSFSVSGGVGFEASERLFLGVTAFRTERAPATEELFSNGPHIATNQFEIGDPTLDEEVAVGVEATVRFATERFSFAVNGFYTTYDDFIFEIPTGEEEGGLPVFQFLAEDADFRGFEAEVGAALFNVGDIGVHLDGQVDFVRADTDDAGDLPRIPPLRGLVGIEARSPYVDLRAEFEGAAAQEDTADFEIPTDGYQTVNLALAFRPMGVDSPFTVNLAANNVNDEEIRFHTSFLKDVAPLPGRNFRISVTGNF